MIRSSIAPNKQEKRRAARTKSSRAIGFEALESRCLLSTFEGSTSAVFAHPSPGRAVVTVSGDHLTYGRLASGKNGGQSSLSFSASPFAADSGEVFPLGKLSFTNTAIQAGTDISSVGLAVTLTPTGGAPETITVPVSISTTPNTDNPKSSGDTVAVAPASLVFKGADGVERTLEVLGFASADGQGGNAELFAEEGQTVSAQLRGRISEMPAAVPATNAPMPSPSIVQNPAPAAPVQTETPPVVEGTPTDVVPTTPEPSLQPPPTTPPPANVVPVPVPTATVATSPVSNPTPAPVPTLPSTVSIPVAPVTTEPVPMPVPIPTGSQTETPSPLATIDAMIPADFLNDFAEGIFHGIDATTDYLDDGAEQVLASPYFQAAGVGIATGALGAGVLGLLGPLAISSTGGFFVSQGLHGLGVPGPIAGAIGAGLGGVGGLTSNVYGLFGINATAAGSVLQPVSAGAIQALSTGSATLVFQEAVPGVVLGGIGGTISQVGGSIYHFIFGPPKRR